MADLKLKPVPHDHAEFMAQATLRPDFSAAYAVLEHKYALARHTLGARCEPGAAQDPTKVQPPHTTH